MNNVIEIEGVTAGYGSLLAVSGITASLPGRQITAVVGPNGSGKSTLVKAVLGLIPLREGRVRVFGQPFHRVRNEVAYVPQKEEVDWHFPLLVGDVVAQGRCRPENVLRRMNGVDRLVIGEALDRLGLTDLVRRPIGQLSGGQKQRVFLARALARQASLYILDEPFNGVDAGTEEVIMEYIQNLKSEGKTVVIVHHKLDEVYNSFDRVLLLNRRMVSFGPTREVFQPETLRLAYSDLPGYTGFHRGELEECLTG